MSSNCNVILILIILEEVLVVGGDNMGKRMDRGMVWGWAWAWAMGRGVGTGMGMGMGKGLGSGDGDGAETREQ